MELYPQHTIDIITNSSSELFIIDTKESKEEVIDTVFVLNNITNPSEFDKELVKADNILESKYFEDVYFYLIDHANDEKLKGYDTDKKLPARQLERLREILYEKYPNVLIVVVDNCLIGKCLNTMGEVIYNHDYSNIIEKLY